MTFVNDISSLQKNEELRLEQLAAVAGLSDDVFSVDDILPGGMGVCVKVIHKNTANLFALKVIQTQYVANKTSWTRHLEELKWWLTLSECDGVAEAYCIERLNDMPCMCATWQHNGSLRPYMGRCKPQFVYRIMSRAIKTLDWAYTNYGVIHRDLKPENILLDQDWMGYISDWGLAKVLAAHINTTASEQQGEPLPLSANLTQQGQILGTIHYASPEQIQGLASVDHRSDIYSIGCMLYEWETGVPPFLGETLADVMRQYVESPPPTFNTRTHRMNLGLDEVTLRCLVKDPAGRFQSHSELAAAMSEAAQSKGIRIWKAPLGQRLKRYNAGVRRKRGVGRPIGCKIDVRGEPQVDVDGIWNQAAAEMGLGNYAQAADILRPLYREVSCRQTRGWDVCHGIGVNYAMCLSMIKPDQGDAIRIFESIMHVERKAAPFYVNYSVALIRNTEYAKAVDIAKEGLELWPTDSDLLGNLAVAQNALGEMDHALATLNRRLAQGKSLHLLAEIGSVLLRMGEEKEEDWPNAVTLFKKATRHFEEAKQLNPRYIPARLALAMTLRKLYRFGAVADECNAIQALARYRSDVESGACIMAELLEDTKAYKDCVAFCDEWLPTLVVEIHKAWMSATRARVLTDHFMIGIEADGKNVFIEDAVQYYWTKVESEGSQNSADLLYWARINEWMKHPDIAAKVHARIQARTPHWWLGHLHRGLFLFRQEQRDEAFQAVEEAARLAPYRPEPMDALTFLYRSAENEAEAEASARRANEILELRKRLSQEYV